jgi:transcription termination factor Rho
LPQKKNPPPAQDSLPFGAGAFDPAPEGPRSEAPRPISPARERASEERSASGERGSDESFGPAGDLAGEERAPRSGRRRRRGRGRGRGRHHSGDERGPAETGRSEDEPVEAEPGPSSAGALATQDDDVERGDEPAGDAEPARDSDAPGGGPVDPSAQPQRRSGRAERRRRWQERRRRRRLGLPLDDLAPQSGGGAPATGATGTYPPRPMHGPQGGPAQHAGHGHGGPPRDARPPQELREVEGLLVLDKGNFGELRRREADFLPSKDDVSIAPWQVQKFALRDGALVRGRYRRGQGRHRWELVDVLAIDGRDPREARNVPQFKNLVTIDPDFHYALGDGSGEVALKVIDVICPIGRGQRGLIVAPPRSGKTILLQQIAKAIEKIYPDVHLMVLLVDERPEEATEWKRSVERGEVYVSTNDEPAKKHVELAEVVWRRARRLVELGKDVVLLLDSITRLGRAANNVWGTSGKTMSGGIDSRALERPKALFGSARNTEKAGSLTILGTTLIDTGSRMDQIIFEEFKGTGNMELVLSRKLADRRIFPAIDLERSGTRKDEKLHSAKRLARCNTLRRVLMRMHFAEAMELLITKLGDVDKIDDFLQRFDIDPDAGDEGKQAVSPVRMRW